MWNVEIISTETVKPSSPTPHHLRTFRLSLLDQLSPSTFVCAIFYFSTPNHENDLDGSLSEILKYSLSQTVVRFYPLAGKLVKEDDTVCCNDQGVEFSEARVHGRLSELLQEPNFEMLNRLVPCDLYGTRSGKDVNMTIQLNTFDCGGVAIGVGITHKLADASTFVNFMNVWAAITRGKTEVPEPTFDSTLLFPPAKALPSPFNLVKQEEKLVCKRFVFNKSSLDELKARASVTHDSTMKYPPTRTEIISALLWRCYIRARGEELSSRATAAIHAVNLRGKMEPSLPRHSFGNLYALAASSGIVAGKKKLNQPNLLERMLRDMFERVDSDHIRELQGPDGNESYVKSMRAAVEGYSECGLDLFSLTSWWKFPFYEVDFGWGKPIWVSGYIYYKDIATLIGTRCGSGIEAWVCLEEKDMDKFEQDQELLSFVSVPIIA